MFPREARSFRSTLAIFALATISLISCASERVTTTPFDFSTTKDYVTGDAAAALGATGKFRLSESLTNPANEISQAAAEKIAVSYARRFGRYHVGRWEGEVGRRIDLSDLSVCDRAFYSRSAYAIPMDAPKEIRRQLGTRWLVSLCDSRGTPLVSLSFSPEATELGADLSATSLAVPDAYFRSSGIAPSVRVTVPIAPEAAAAEASKFSLLRVSGVPELVRPPHPESDLLSRWRTPLEAELSVLALSSTNSDASQLTAEVFVGFGASFGAIGVLGATSEMTVPPLVVQDGSGREWTLAPASVARLEWVRRGGGR